MGVAAQSELKAAVQTCIAGAAAKGYTQEELAACCLQGPEYFKAVAAGADLTFFDAVEIARTCGYRLRISLEQTDDEIQSAPEEIRTPFEVTAGWMANHALLKHLPELEREEILRQILSHYFGQMREKGLYIAKRGE